MPTEINLTSAAALGGPIEVEWNNNPLSSGLPAPYLNIASNPVAQRPAPKSKSGSTVQVIAKAKGDNLTSAGVSITNDGAKLFAQIEPKPGTPGNAGVGLSVFNSKVQVNVNGSIPINGKANAGSFGVGVGLNGQGDTSLKLDYMTNGENSTASIKLTHKL